MDRNFNLNICGFHKKKTVLYKGVLAQTSWLSELVTTWTLFTSPPFYRTQFLWKLWNVNSIPLHSVVAVVYGSYCKLLASFPGLPSLVPRPLGPPLFIIYWFEFSWIHRSGRATLPLLCIILNANRRTKKWRRPENEASELLQCSAAMKTAPFLPGPSPDTAGDKDAAQWHGSAGGEKEWNCGTLQWADCLRGQTGT